MTALYDTIGKTYAQFRRPDPRIAHAIESALGNARSVANIGSGTGSYEPADRRVVAVEPSRVMLKQRPYRTVPALQGVAGHLPFQDATFDASLAVLTLHHWPNAAAGLAEMTRVAPVQVVLTWDPAIAGRFWLIEEYLPLVAQHEEPLATLKAVCDALHVTDILTIPVPWDCTDGFFGAYWRRPQAYLDPRARAAISSLAVLDEQYIDNAMRQLKRDLDDGLWDARHRHLSSLEELDLGYRLVIGRTA